MKCVICKQADVQKGWATVTLDKDSLTLVFKRVPARVCPNCGEEYVDEAIAAELLQNAEALARAGAQVDVREYVAA
jgi:YgiT-type zinc finger domain-containing protein